MFEKLDLKFLKDNFDKNYHISKKKTNEFNLPLVNAKHGNNGVMYYGRKKDFEYASMTIDIVNDGAVSTGDVYPQIKETGVLYNAYLIKPIFKATERLLFFFSSSIQKSIKLKYGYENKAGWGRVKNDYIKLPTKNNEIDFQFMEDFIAELEAQRIAELEAYLTVTGLKNYQLTEDEKYALERLKNVEFKEYRLGDLFDKKTIRGVPKSEENLEENLNGYHIFGQNIRYQYQQKVLLDNKYLTKVDKNKPILAYTSSTCQIGIIRESFYRTGNNGAFQGLFPNFEQASPHIITFILTSLKKLFADLGYSSSMEKAMDIKFKLPTKNNEIDFQFMETLISAVQKLVIKEVVDWTDAKINATQEVVNR